MSAETDRIITLNGAPTVMTYDKSFVGIMEQCNDGNWCRKDDVDAAWDESIKALNYLYKGKAIKANNEHIESIKKINMTHYHGANALCLKYEDEIKEIDIENNKLKKGARLTRGYFIAMMITYVGFIVAAAMECA